ALEQIAVAAAAHRAGGRAVEGKKCPAPRCAGKLPRGSRRRASTTECPPASRAVRLHSGPAALGERLGKFRRQLPAREEILREGDRPFGRFDFAQHRRISAPLRSTSTLCCRS